ncbi:hypothetical protein EDB85DRAFT_1984256 [Lactarius pseudohatsudake]|nr:hypothetical protein EDB85DRAFT_1983761 [Lactarius pseudohatsudake]KAH9025320.1 hypothetical protein EDB85DRAFT_1984256 [Lactarius pseudohatsudake]
MLGSPSARTFNIATNRQSLAFLSSPDAANTVGNSSDAATTLAQQRAELNAAGKAAYRISVPALASSGERGTWAGVLARSRSGTTPPHKIYPWSPGRFGRVPTSLASPVVLPSAPRAPMAAPLPVVSTGFPLPSATAGPAW